VITGGSGGIGLATAQRFVREGAYAFDMGRRQGEVDKAEALVGDGVSTVSGGTTNGADLDKVFATQDVLVGACVRARDALQDRVSARGPVADDASTTPPFGVGPLSAEGPQ
jgi:NAD(P)-dependent dehydrogenase (short-subunit alcohol dehydrogenase family)